MLTTTDLDLLSEELPDAIYNCLGQLSHYDRLIYFWAGRSFYSGFGTIVDAGALVGGTATLLAYGLTKNARAGDTTGRILSYDQFEDVEGGVMASAIGEWPGAELPHAHDGKIDFEPVFRKRTEEHAVMIEIRRGDITKLGYRDAMPIEIMSVDVGKTPDLMYYLAREFFPRLVPDRSIVLNQDYLFPFQPWVIIAMELLSDCFELEYAAPNNTTVVHRCTRSVSADLVDDRLRDFWTPAHIQLIERAAGKLSTPMHKATMRAAQIHAMLLFGMKKAATRAGRQMQSEFFLTLEEPKFARLFRELGLLKQS